MKRSLKIEYTYGNYLDETLILTDSTGASDVDYYYAHNHLYSPVALMEDDGDVVERYEYDVYGKQYVMEEDYDPRTSSSYDNVIAFTGQRQDRLDSGDLQLMYYKNRYYCTTTGRFLQRDPLGVIPGANKNNRFSPDVQYTDGMNLFEYVNSKPIHYTDPYGLSVSSVISLYELLKKWESLMTREINLNITEDNFSRKRGLCGWFILRSFSDIKIDLTWNETEKGGCFFWKKSDDDIRKEIEDAGTKYMKWWTDKGAGPRFDCHKPLFGLGKYEYDCCFMTPFNGKYTINILFNDFPMIPPKNVFTKCFLTGVISIKVDIRGELGRCVKVLKKKK